VTTATTPNAAELISQLSGDSRNAQLAQLLMAMNGGEQSNDDESARGEYKAMLERFKRFLSELRRENSRLREVNNGLLAHSELLAGAIGACPECWGEDPQCTFCDGDGGPGAFLPEDESFEEFVKPVLRMVRENMIQKRRNHQKAAATQSLSQAPQEKEEYENERH